MMKENIIEMKSYAFAIKIIQLYNNLVNERKEYALGRQIMRCGTSVGANIAEATGAISKREFIAKMQISYKEAHETRYWLRILHDTAYIDNITFEELISDNEEIIRILVAILKSSKAA